MADIPITESELIKAHYNLVALDGIMNGSINTTVTTPDGQVVKSVAKALNDVAFATSTAVNYKGQWAIGTTYNIAQTVTASNGLTYASKTDSNVGNDPIEDDGTNWNPTGTIYANNIEQLRSLIPIIDGFPCLLLGYYVAGDKEPIFGIYNASSTAIDNGGSIIRPNSINELEAGRWHFETRDIRDYGATTETGTFSGLSIIDAESAAHAMLESENRVIIPDVPNVFYQIDTSLVLSSDTLVLGAGMKRSKILLSSEFSGDYAIVMSPTDDFSYRNISIRNISIYGQKASAEYIYDTGIGGIDIAFTKESCEISNVHLRGLKIGVGSRDTSATFWESSFDNCKIEYCYTGFTFVTNTSARIFNNTVLYTARPADVTNARIENCTFQNDSSNRSPLNSGVLCNGVVKIRKCYFEGLSKSVDCAASSTVTVEDSYFGFTALYAGGSPHYHVSLGSGCSYCGIGNRYSATNTIKFYRAGSGEIISLLREDFQGTSDNIFGYDALYPTGAAHYESDIIFETGGIRKFKQGIDVNGDNLFSVDANRYCKIRLSGAAPTSSIAGDTFAEIQFYNKDTSGDGANIAAAISAVTTNDTDQGGALVFKTTNSSSGVEGASATEQYKMDTTAFYPTVDNAKSFGTAVYRPSVYYGATGTINTSDAREKTTITKLTENELAAARELLNEIGTYCFLSAIELKGAAAARYHIGLTVQKAIEIMTKHNLDPFKYAFICYDEWFEDYIISPETDFEPAVIGTRKVGDRYGFRYDQLILFMLSGFFSKIETI